MCRKRSLVAEQARQEMARVAVPQAPPPEPRTVGRAEMSAANLAVELERTQIGTFQVLVRYCGPLAARPRLLLRFGERRRGHDWVEPRDVAMISAPGEKWAVVCCSAETALEGGCLAFHAQKNGVPGIEVWDNAGRPNGYYAFDARTGGVEARG